MKTLTVYFKNVLILILSFSAFTSCINSDDETMPIPNTIVDFVSNSPDYSILLEALQLANGNLPDVLDGAGPFTVFAPNNEAFATFLSDNNFSALLT
jgi:transforming growth factor-beta-induced protein